MEFKWILTSAHLINSWKEGHEAAENSCTDAGDVDKRTLRQKNRKHFIKKNKRSFIKEEEQKRTLITSFPTGMPLPRAAVRPMTFAIKALRVRYSLSTTPLRMVFSSGIPEPSPEGEAGTWDKIEQFNPPKSGTHYFSRCLWTNTWLFTLFEWIIFYIYMTDLVKIEKHDTIILSLSILLLIVWLGVQIK